MPDRDTVGAAGARTCPSCGALNSATDLNCAQCGFELGFEEEEALDFEEFEERTEDEGPEPNGLFEVEPEDAELIDDDEFQEVPRARARAVPGPDSLIGPTARRPGPPPDRRRMPPPGSRPSAGMGARQRPPAAPPKAMAPPKPAAKPQKPIDPFEHREKLMGKYTLYLVIIGFVSYGVNWAVPGIMGAVGAGTVWWIGRTVVNLVILCLVAVFGINASRWSGRSTDKTTPIEGKNLGRVNLGIGILLMIFIIQVFGVHRAIPGIPDPGNYNSGWSIVYVIISLPGVIFLVKGLYAIREKLSYYKIWKNGIWLLILAPLTGMLDSLSPAMMDYGTILNYQPYFAYSVASFFIIMTVIAFGMKMYLGTRFKSLEDETTRGEELFKAGRYREAMERFDIAIDIGHDLFAQYFYDPDNPRLAQQMRLPAQYGIPWLRKGDIYTQVNRPRKAIAIFDVILELDPRNEVVWNRKGEVLLSMGKLEEAQRCFDQALTAVPNYSKAVLNKQKVQAAIRQAREG